ncbi:MAG: hypothetical protein EOO38_14005, partial [Cytophagaceae bacterium]
MVSILILLDDPLLTFSDLLGVPDHAVWTYGQKLRQLSKTKGYTHIEFARLKDLLGIPNIRDNMEDMAYTATAPSIRLALMHRFGSLTWDTINDESCVRDDESKRLTYCGYLKFLSLDLANTFPIGPGRTKSAFKRGVEVIAKTMLKRGEAFARAVRENYPNHVRLSIHPSTGEDKISINVLPIQKTITPWHSAIAILVDGTVVAGQRKTFEEDANLELVYEDGQPSYFRERTQLFQWSPSTRVTFEPMYPCGMMIRPSDGAKGLTIRDVDAQKVRQLARCKNRFFLNYCTFGYSMPWWQWNDWQWFIDWMALNGINTPLAITGQEAVWYRVWKKFGLTDAQIRGYFTGPAFLPWHRMANLDHWDGPLPQSWISSQLKLQQKIVARERELGMAPVLPAFAGHVPQLLKTKFP